MVHFNPARVRDSSLMAFATCGEVATSWACTKKPRAGEGTGLNFSQDADSSRVVNYFFLVAERFSSIAACAAARRATGTRYGEQLT